MHFQKNNVVFLLILLIGFRFSSGIKADDRIVSLPFSVDSNYLTVWNGKDYIPFFVKGTILSIAKPGTYPGDLNVSREQYRQWFAEIKNAGFNCIRIYTLHFPHFYEELKDYNTKNPQHPLFFFQGVWLNEQLAYYYNDLYLMSDTFKTEISQNIDCVHGRKSIKKRYGKAYGEYCSDVSKWNIGYIIGREIYPEEILETNKRHANNHSFTGNAFSLENGSASEIWLTMMLDHLVTYERVQYNTQRPVSASSWPLLDPLIHPEELNRMNDTVSVDLSKIKNIDAPAGLFISYHAYPYYPDFIEKNPLYTSYSDSYGLNTYKGYLTHLKSHYKHHPLIIAEYGTPSSWGIAKYASSGMNQGGYNELLQGEANLRLLKTISDVNLGGGIQFSWLDEWFKKTWITESVDFGNKSLWHNITAAEQNFGLKKFTRSTDWFEWKRFDSQNEITKLSARANYDFFELKIDLKERMDINGECWIGLDTYDANLGESLLPNGYTLPSRAEFSLHITQHSAQLYVTEAYDLFGLSHKQRVEKQMYKSTVSNGAPWKIVRWKNGDNYSDVHFIGELKINKSNQPLSTDAAVIIFENEIHVRLPWTLINFVDPSQKSVFHVFEDSKTKTSDGIAVGILYKNKTYYSDTRFVWDNWDKVSEDLKDEFKLSYWKMYENLPNYNSPAIAFPDTFVISDSKKLFMVDSKNGLLRNDFDFDGNNLHTILIDKPLHGKITLNPDGSFVYIARNLFKGVDKFTYTIFDGRSWSSKTNVLINVKKRVFINNTSRTK